MVLVEFVRMIIVLAFTAAGYQSGIEFVGRFGIQTDTPEAGRLIASVIGAALGYVIGGVFGRALQAGVGVVERRVDKVSGGELFTGFLGSVAGVVVSIMASWPIIVFIPIPMVALPAAAIVSISLTYLTLRISIHKRFELLQMMGLSQVRDFLPPMERTEYGRKVLDTSAIIDGRIVHAAKSGFLAGSLVCPGFVLAELRNIAESDDPMKRARGRRGLETLDALQGESNVRLDVTDDLIPSESDVDTSLIALSKRLRGSLVTTDFNLHKNAELQGVPVLNVNTLAAGLKPVMLPGQEISVQIIREGTQAEQGVGYLEDGTMVVVEGARALVGSEVLAVVTSALQTAAGRMLFSVAKNQPAPAGE